MKGQNLRVLIHDQCVAGSISANLSLNAQTENSTTNDTTGDFDELEVTGKSWEITTEALYFAGMTYYNKITNFAKTTIDMTVYFVNDELIKVPSGHSISVKNDTIDNSLLLTNSDNTEVITIATHNKDLFYLNNTDQDIHVHVGRSFIPSALRSLEVTVWDSTAHLASDCFYEFMNHEKVFVRLAITTGEKNREVVSDVVGGEGYITELTFNSANRQHPSFTAKITGDGSLL